MFNRVENTTLIVRKTFYMKQTLVWLSKCLSTNGVKRFGYRFLVAFALWINGLNKTYQNHAKGMFYHIL